RIVYLQFNHQHAPRPPAQPAAPPHAPLAQAPRPAPPDAVKTLHVRIR
ncbi:hypothetical protein A2U01_0081412, partial [Trifolium medium]|nr:hypothetical protein [Trifolium medium]